MSCGRKERTRGPKPAKVEAVAKLDDDTGEPVGGRDAPTVEGALDIVVRVAADGRGHVPAAFGPAMRQRQVELPAGAQGQAAELLPIGVHHGAMRKSQHLQ